MSEIWKDIPEFNGYYQVSSIGRVKRTETGYIRKNRYDHNGYVEVKLMVKGRPYFRKVHRLVAQTFIPNPDNLATVNHKNGIKTDNRVENLEWMALADNARHSLYVLGNYDKTLGLKGENRKGGRGKGTKVRCVETGQVYNSISEAVLATCGHQGNISRAIQKGWKSGGYHWTKES